MFSLNLEHLLNVQSHLKSENETLFLYVRCKLDILEYIKKYNPG